VTSAEPIVHYSRLPFNEAQEKPKLEAGFPYVVDKPYEITSCSTIHYNCFAWAAEDDTRRWLPEINPDGRTVGGFYWPTEPEIPALLTVWALEKVYETRGFVPCDDGGHVPGVQKLAIYGYDRHSATHAARQTDTGTWLSKMGPLADIEHERVDDIVGGMVAEIQAYMSRPWPTQTTSLPGQRPLEIAGPTQAPPKVSELKPQLLLPRGRDT
jgi:hypothetical protein